MKLNKLGASDLLVSELCLGTMTFGTQTPEADAHRQLDMAMDHGINIADSAEMYPVYPVSAETQGDSERVIGKWLAKTGHRDKIVIATKVAGNGYKNVRNGAPISSETISLAIEASLRSLRTDYIDIYQLHWPNRGSYMFRQNWNFDPTQQDKSKMQDHVEDVLQRLDELVAEGKVRKFGLSNESAWGTAQWLKTAADNGWPKVETIQNEYSLLCRLFDTDLAELAHNEKVGLLAYSPLATGLLTGKYKNGAVPAGSRKSIDPCLNGRATSRVWPAIGAYEEIANNHGLDLPLMALAWCCTRPFMASAILGATKSEQLKYLLQASEIKLTEECLREINAAHRTHPMPY